MTLQPGTIAAPDPSDAASDRRASPWLTSYPPGVPARIDPDAYPSLHALLLEACRTYAQRPAFECLHVRMSYAEWERDSRDFAAFLTEELHCRPGDRVAIMLPNLLAYPVTFLGVLRAGLVVVNVNPLYTPRELEHQLKDSGAKAIVIIENFATTLQEVLPAVPTKKVVLASLGDMLGLVKGTLVNYVVRKVDPAYFDKKPIEYPPAAPVVVSAVETTR